MRPLGVQRRREPSWFACDLEINVVRVVRHARTKALINYALDRDEGEHAHEAAARLQQRVSRGSVAGEPAGHGDQQPAIEHRCARYLDLAALLWRNVALHHRAWREKKIAIDRVVSARRERAADPRCRLPEHS